MKLTQYEADTLLMAVRFQMANDPEITEEEWNDLITMRDRLEAMSIFMAVFNG